MGNAVRKTRLQGGSWSDKWLEFAVQALPESAFPRFSTARRDGPAARPQRLPASGSMRATSAALFLSQLTPAGSPLKNKRAKRVLYEGAA
jgi:hypothetical protein